ncbi:MAG: hypothetical protein HY606_12885, partial [Planctomycetes bacterium]|nr:hypothetical protein [Planctomycetota bacterium]
RTQAVTELDKMGMVVIPYIRELLNSENPDLKKRAETLLDKYSLLLVD